MRKVLVISGPGGMAFDSGDVKKVNEILSQNGEVFSVGDGEKTITLEQIQKKLEEINLNNNEDALTIFIYMHGKIENGNFIFMNGNDSFSSQELFSLIAKNDSHTPVDIVSLSCHGGGCLKDIDILPENSVVVTLSHGSTTLSGFDVDRFIHAISNTEIELSANNLLNCYMTKALQNRNSPELGISGKDGHISFGSLLERKIGQKINRDKVLECVDGMINPDEANEIIDKIEKSKSEWEIYALEYGKALAICSADEFGSTINQHNFSPIMGLSGERLSAHSARSFFESRASRCEFNEVLDIGNQIISMMRSLNRAEGGLDHE